MSTFNLPWARGGLFTSKKIWEGKALALNNHGQGKSDMSHMSQEVNISVPETSSFKVIL